MVYGGSSIFGMGWVDGIGVLGVLIQQGGKGILSSLDASMLCIYLSRYACLNVITITKRW